MVAGVVGGLDLVGPRRGGGRPEGEGEGAGAAGAAGADVH